MTATFTGEAWCERLMQLREATIQELGDGFADMTLMDVQNCLCEFDKYERVRLGQGCLRSYYKPETAYHAPEGLVSSDRLIKRSPCPSTVNPQEL